MEPRASLQVETNRLRKTDIIREVIRSFKLYFSRTFSAKQLVNDVGIRGHVASNSSTRVSLTTWRIGHVRLITWESGHVSFSHVMFGHVNLG